MADDAQNRRKIVGTDAAFKAMAAVRGCGAQVAICKKCSEPSPSLNAAGYCEFCELTMALNATGVPRIRVTARFIWAGTC